MICRKKRGNYSFSSAFLISSNPPIMVFLMWITTELSFPLMIAVEEVILAIMSYYFAGGESVGYELTYLTGKKWKFCKLSL